MLTTRPKDIDAPLQATNPATSGSAGPEPSAEQVSMLADMGFTHAQAKKALRETVSCSELIFKEKSNMHTKLLLSSQRTATPNAL
jgi:hypothetical protein